MLFFLICVLMLFLGYLIYGRIVERIFAIEPSRPTPAIAKKDGVDYVPMPTWKVFLIQLLDIAGIGPVFGPILGALYGLSSLIWIVIGSIFAGGVHDFFSGMLSVRNDGKSIPEVIGDAFGTSARVIMRVFSLLLLILVAVVFVLSPAKLLNELIHVDTGILVVLIFAYYFLATILPIDKLIGRLYPFFGFLFIFMAFGITVALFFSDHAILPNLNFSVNTNPDKTPIWPLLFITLSCGALSGFHSTQSPIMARCLKNEKHGRSVFYGAMIMEGIIALIWATVGLSFYETPQALNSVIAASTPSGVVYEASMSLLGKAGGFLAVIGVVILPITSGDTAFRSSRLIIADTFGMGQKKIRERLTIAVPLFIVGFIISKSEFETVWRYFGWANQALAMLVLWSAAIFLARKNKFHYIASLPAAFMTAVVITFILNAKIGLNLGYNISVAIGMILSILSYFVFIHANRKQNRPI